MVVSTAQPGTTSRRWLIRYGDGRMMATPVCRLPRGPWREHDAAICVKGAIPDGQYASVSLSQC
eukprot:341138-Lingulodinium_polyedra.AAC.1